jgi:hypothetical protein
VKKHDKPCLNLPEIMTGGRSYEDLRMHFIELLDKAGSEVRSYTGPSLMSPDRVTYIIPPVTDIERRDEWNPGDIYVVREGMVAIGRVFYTRTSGEYLIEELVLRPGDIFGEFEVPLSILGSGDITTAKLPPRFNMTYGAWASGPALAWSMSYPRDIPRDNVAPLNAKVAVHPFYIKSKNIRPETNAKVSVLPVGAFEEMVSANPPAMTWFLMNVLLKTRLYFEPPSQGYGRSPVDHLARLFIRILAYRMRLGLVVNGEEQGRKVCRTFMGPTEWLRYGLGAFAADLKEVLHEYGAVAREQFRLPVFDDEMNDLIDVRVHFPVKDIDDEMLVAMGCSPNEDRHENRYGLLTGIRIELNDVERFNRSLLERGE